MNQEFGRTNLLRKVCVLIMVMASKPGLMWSWKGHEKSWNLKFAFQAKVMEVRKICLGHGKSWNFRFFQKLFKLMVEK